MTNRAEIQKEQRRRRNADALAGRRRLLGVDMSRLDQENFAYRIVNDTETRLHDLTVNDDWEVVQDRDGAIKPDGTGTGAEVAMPVGGGMRGVLLRKRKDWHNDDLAAKQRQIDETEAAIKHATKDGMYVPGGKDALTTSRT